MPTLHRWGRARLQAETRAYRNVPCEEVGMSTRTTEEIAAAVVDRVLARLDTLGHKFDYDKEHRRILLLYPFTTREGQTTNGVDVLRALVREELERP